MALAREPADGGVTARVLTHVRNCVCAYVRVCVCVCVREVCIVRTRANLSNDTKCIPARRSSEPQIQKPLKSIAAAACART